MATNIKKQILHIDYDSFFASVEQQANPALRGKPIAITGSSVRRGIACTASKEAKKFGIKTGMPIFKVRELCPEIIVIKGDATKYTYIHNESLKIFNKYTDLVEPFSIDEAFLDVTGTQKLFSSAENIARLIKKDIRKAFGEYVTCSIGIGPNKLLAKLVSDFNKPDGLFVVTESNLQTVLHKVQLQDFCGIGPRLEKRLNALGITTVEQLQDTPLRRLYAEFGNVGGSFMKDLSMGVNYSTVKPLTYERPVKSVSHQHTLYKNTRDPEIIKANLRRLSEMVGKRMRQHNVKGQYIHIFLRDADMHFYGNKTRIGRPTNSGREIFSQVDRLFTDMRWTKNTRLVGVGVTNLLTESHCMKPLFPEDEKAQALGTALDKINDRFGNFTLIPASTLRADSTKTKISSFLKHH